MTQKNFEFTITRTFDAPLATVWNAWTDETRLAQWFGPAGCTITYSKLILKPGGTYDYSMDFNGFTMHGRWQFLEIVSHEKLVTLSSFSSGPGGEPVRHPMAPTWPLLMHATTEFTARGNQTEVRVKWRAHEASDVEKLTFEQGAASMTQGWTGTFERLETYLKKAVAA